MNGIVASTVGEENYVLELAIPWTSLNAASYLPETGSTVGMSLLATHNGDPGKWGQIMWVGTGDDQAEWADMHFE